MKNIVYKKLFNLGIFRKTPTLYFYWSCEKGFEFIKEIKMFKLQAKTC